MTSQEPVELSGRAAAPFVGEAAGLLLETIDRLYEAAVDSAKWTGFLETAARLFRSRGAQIAHIDHSEHRLGFTVEHGYRMTPEVFRRYEELMPEDPRLPAMIANPYKPFHCRMIVPDEELHASRVYREVLSQAEIEYSLGVSLVNDSGAMSYFNALRDRSYPPFTAADCRLLGELVVHLKRAIGIRSEFIRLDYERALAVGTLNEIPTGIFLVTRDGWIRGSNSAAARIAGQKSGLKIVAGHLVASDREDGMRLAAVVRSAADAAAQRRSLPGRTLALRSPDGQPPLTLLVCPLLPGELQKEVPLDTGVASVFVNDPSRPQESCGELLQRIYGLTPSQARLAEKIHEGATVREAARQLGLTEASGRQYLKLILEKTSCRRQAELIRLMSRLREGLPLSSQWDDAGGPRSVRD